MQFTAGGNPLRPFYLNDSSPYHIYFHREEPEVVFAGVDTGVPNVARTDGLTLLDVLWSGAPFATQSQFRRAVRDTAAAFMRSGLLTGAQNRRLVAVAELRQPFKELGQVATRLLVDTAAGKPPVTDRFELATMLTVRLSTAPARPATAP